MFLKYLRALWDVLFNKKVSYGVSFDDTILLEELPRGYPKPFSQYRFQVENGTYMVLETCKKEGTVVVRNTTSRKIFEIDIELFDEIFLPIDPNDEYVISE